MNGLQSVGEFILTHRNMQCKPRGAVYSINEGYSKHWTKGVAEYVRSRKDPPVRHQFSKHLHT